MKCLSRSRSWRAALSASTAFGLALGTAALAAEPPKTFTDSADAVGEQDSPRELDMDAAFQQLGVLTVKSGSSSTSVRKLAIGELPLDVLTAEGRSKGQAVLDNLGMFRRLPTLSSEVDPDVYEFFLRNPDIAVSTWRAMEISKFQLKKIDPDCYAADAGDGSVGRIEVLHHAPGSTLIHCDGAFKSPLLSKPIVARSLMRLQTTFAKEADGRIIGTHSGDVFVEFPSQAVETVAKVISPVSHSIADRNFKQITLFAHLMTQTMAKHPGWIEMIGNKLDGVGAEQRLQFLEVSARSYVKSRKRLAGQHEALSLDEVLSPFRVSDGSAQPTLVPISNRPGTAVLRD